MEKDKKKVIVSTIIASVFLLVLIIGATYAYFGAGNSASGTTNLNASTEAIGNVIVTNPTDNLYLKLSANDMQQSNAGTSYYATSTDGGSSVYSKEKENHILANYTISGGQEDTIYNCTFDLNITKPNELKYGDMTIELTAPYIEGSNILHIDLSQAQSTYEVEFTKIGNGTGDLVKGDITLENRPIIQDHLLEKILTTTISISNLNCEVKDSICELVSGTDGVVGAKYNCGVSPNAIQTFYLLDNNDDGTSDLIMDANINAAGEKVIPGVTSDIGLVAWLSNERYDSLGGEDLSNDEGPCQHMGFCATNIYGPVTAMEYLHNATKSWSNVEPVNYTYNDRTTQGITTADIGYESFISSNGISIITAGNPSRTQVTIGTETEPLRARMLIYPDETNITIDINDNIDSGTGRPGGYWTMSSYNGANGAAVGGRMQSAGPYGVYSSGGFGVRPVITVKL